MSDPYIPSFNPYRVFSIVATIISCVPGVGHNKVSIPIGFSLSLRLPPSRQTAELPPQVSIPIGFSLSLRPYDPAAACPTWLGFNPYRVFSIVATRLRVGDGRRRLVSIPIGFSLSLRHEILTLPHYFGPWFQSLSGFLYRCDGGTVPELNSVTVVSIPIGFSLSLRPYLSTTTFSSISLVSIPIGFSLSLRLGQWFIYPESLLKFQSLSGFLYRCDSISGSSSARYSYVSIPIGFSLSLRPTLIPAPVRGAITRFQSLSGFLYRCDTGSATVADADR